MPSASTAAKRDKQLTLRPNDLISVAECNALIEKRVQRLQRRLLIRVALLISGAFVLYAVAGLALRLVF